MQNRIADLFENTLLSIQQIADTIGSTYKPVYNKIRKMYSSAQRKARKSKVYSLSKTGAKNPCFGKHAHNYEGVPVSDNKGYLMVLKPSWYTGRKKSSYVFEHSVVMCLHMGITEIPAGYCVHHKDLNPTNNRIENLILLTTTEHQQLHSRLRRAETISKESRA